MQERINMKNSSLLEKWLARTLIDNPDLINKSDTPTDIYVKLEEIWLKEIQVTFKTILKKTGLLKKL